MAKVPWSDVMALHSRAHLVVAAIPEMEQLGPDLKEAQFTLNRFLGQRIPGATLLGSSIVRTPSHPELHFAFAEETDACKFAEELGCGVVDRYPGWASQRAVDLTVQQLAEIRAVAPPRQKGRQSEAPDQPGVGSSESQGSR